MNNFINPSISQVYRQIPPNSIPGQPPVATYRRNTSFARYQQQIMQGPNRKLIIIFLVILVLALGYFIYAYIQKEWPFYNSGASSNGSAPTPSSSDSTSSYWKLVNGIQEGQHKYGDNDAESDAEAVFISCNAAPVCKAFNYNSTKSFYKKKTCGSFTQTGTRFTLIKLDSAPLEDSTDSNWKFTNGEILENAVTYVSDFDNTLNKCLTDNTCIGINFENSSLKKINPDIINTSPGIECPSISEGNAETNGEKEQKSAGSEETNGDSEETSAESEAKAREEEMAKEAAKRAEKETDRIKELEAYTYHTVNGNTTEGRNNSRPIGTNLFAREATNKSYDNITGISTEPISELDKATNQKSCPESLPLSDETGSQDKWKMPEGTYKITVKIKNLVLNETAELVNNIPKQLLYLENIQFYPYLYTIRSSTGEYIKKFNKEKAEMTFKPSEALVMYFTDVEQETIDNKRYYKANLNYRTNNGTKSIYFVISKQGIEHRVPINVWDEIRAYLLLEPMNCFKSAEDWE